MNLDYTDIVHIKNAFVDNGYVLDFNNSTFSDFTLDVVSVDIQRYYGGSKGASLIAFFKDKEVSIDEKIKLLKELLKCYEAYKINHMYDTIDNPNIAFQKIKANSIKQCKLIIKKYSNINIDICDSIREEGISELIEKANKYLSSDVQTALEKIWDAFERIKTVLNGDKKASVNHLIDKMSNNNPKHKELIEDEFRYLTSIGNNFRIRHHEMNKIDIVSDDFRIYLFNRCISLIKFALKYID